MITNSDRLQRTPRHEHACQALVDGITAAHPRTVIEQSLTLADGILTVGDSEYDLDEYDEIRLLGGGNAAGAATEALETLLGDRLAGGIVVTDDPVSSQRVEVVEGTHPLPSDANVAGTARVLEAARAVGEETLVLVVVAGGGSALLASPAGDISVENYRELTTQLLESGATIGEINAVRKHISTIKGGQLARELAPATTVGLIFSDVVGNRLDVIASGPITPDGTTYADAREVLTRYDIDPPAAIADVLAAGERGERSETPGPGDPVFERVETHILADNRTALDAASETLEKRGYRTAILSTGIEGEASDVGRVHAAIAAQCHRTDEPFEKPVALLSGGETTVTVDSGGTGGPNQEFALGATVELGEAEIVVAAVDTDGIDGPTDAAGAVLDPTVIDDESESRTALETNDVYPYLAERDALVRTGPTGTNVNDLRVVLVGEVPGDSSA